MSQPRLDPAEAGEQRQVKPSFKQISQIPAFQNQNSHKVLFHFFPCAEKLATFSVILFFPCILCPKWVKLGHLFPSQSGHLHLLPPALCRGIQAVSAWHVGYFPAHASTLKNVPIPVDAALPRCGKLHFGLPPRVFASAHCSLALLQLLGGDGKTKSLPPTGRISDAMGTPAPVLSQPGETCWPCCTGLGGAKLLSRRLQKGGKGRAVLRYGCQKKKKKRGKSTNQIKFSEMFSSVSKGSVPFLIKMHFWLNLISLGLPELYFHTPVSPSADGSKHKMFLSSFFKEMEGRRNENGFMKPKCQSKSTCSRTTCTPLLPFGLQKAPSEAPPAFCNVFGTWLPGKWCWELGEKELIRSWESEDLHGPCLYIAGEIFLRGLRIQDLREFHPGDRLGVRIYQCSLS